MAAGKDQAKTIVRNLVCVVIWLLDLADQTRSGIRFEFFLESRFAPDAVNGLVPSCLNYPRAREFRDTGNSPLIRGGYKCFLRGFFGKVEVADEPYQGGHDAAPIGAIDCFDGLGGVQRHT